MNLELIRQVLASAARAKLPMAQEAMQELTSINGNVLTLKEEVASLHDDLEELRTIQHG